MQNANQPHPNQEIYESLDALDEYLLGTRTRREQRRKLQIEIKRICVAIGKVTTELEAAQQDEDTEIALELQHVLHEFEARLERTRLSASEAVVTVPPTLEIQPPLAEHPKAEEAPAREEVTLEIPASVHPDISQEETESYTPPTNPLILSEDEIEAKTLEWNTEIESISVLWKALESAGLRQKDNDLNRPACFRVRALACSLARIEAVAEQTGLRSHILKSVTALRDKMELARTYAGDTSDILPFTLNSETDDTTGLSVEAWDELTSLYESVAEAQEAFNWYLSVREETASGGQSALVNAIGAVQQMLFRALDEYGGTDRLQGDLYGALRECTNTVGFLKSLHADTTWEELAELARALPSLFASAQKETTLAHERQVKEAAKTSAMAALLTWREQGYGKLGSPTSEKFRAELSLLLDACAAAGIPPTNVQVRESLLDIAPTALQDILKHAKFLEAVLKERTRRGLDTVASEISEEVDEEEDLSEAVTIESKGLVVALAEGQKVLLLGGSARPLVAERLKQEIQCAEVEWIDSKRGDRMNKFKRDILRADIVVVLKKFASHEMTEKGRDWSKENGKLFVLLPGGYGVNQIINQMYLQLIQNDSSKRLEMPIAKQIGLGNAVRNFSQK